MKCSNLFIETNLNRIKSKAQKNDKKWNEIISRRSLLKNAYSRLYDTKNTISYRMAVAETLYLVSIALASPGTVGGTRCRGVYISSFSCLTYTTILVSGGGKDFLRLSGITVLFFRRDSPGGVGLEGDTPSPPRTECKGGVSELEGMYRTGIRDKSTIE